MRILTVGMMYPPHHLGGYELAWESAIDGLRASGHEVRVLTSGFRLPAIQDPHEPETDRALELYWVDDSFHRLGWPALVRLERRNAQVLDRHIDEFRPDIVNWWAMSGVSLSLIERVRRRGLPAVGVVCDDWLVYGPRVDRWTWTFLRERRFGRVRACLGAGATALTGVPSRFDPAGAGQWLFVSETTRSWALRERWARGLRTGICHSGVDPQRFPLAPVRDWDWRLLYVGRIDPRKGIDTAIRALAELPDGATLRIKGGGNEEHARELRTLAVDLGLLRRVTFEQAASQAELAGVYAAADALIFPVRWEEPWGLAPIEAMAVGRPVLATGKGGSSEYLRDEENCLLFPADDASALAAAVQRLGNDEGLRARLRKTGVRTASRHTTADTTRCIEAALERECRRAMPT